MMLLRNRRFLIGLLAALVVGGGSAAWLGRDSLRTWYYLRGLERAEETERDAYVQRVAGLGSAAVPAAVGRLRNPDPRACDNLHAALACLAEQWPAEDPRRVDLGGRLVDGFPSFSTAGQRAALRLAADWVRPRSVERRPPAPAVQVAARLLMEAARTADPDVRAAALELAANLLDGGDWTGLLGPCRDLAQACLRDDRAENRAGAVRLALHPGMDLAEQVFPLLHDPAAEVRRAAMLVVGAARNTIATDQLLPWLHDPDPEVVRNCEAALLARDLKPHHLKLARLISHPEPRMRLRVLAYLDADGDLDPAAWLHRLSNDPREEVRAAAIRAAVEGGIADLSDRIKKMREEDPSPTVRQLAHLYLGLQSRHARLGNP